MHLAANLRKYCFPELGTLPDEVQIYLFSVNQTQNIFTLIWHLDIFGSTHIDMIHILFATHIN